MKSVKPVIAVALLTLSLSVPAFAQDSLQNLGVEDQEPTIQLTPRQLDQALNAVQENINAMSDEDLSQSLNINSDDVNQQIQSSDLSDDDRAVVSVALSTSDSAAQDAPPADQAPTQDGPPAPPRHRTKVGRILRGIGHGLKAGLRGIGIGLRDAGRGIGFAAVGYDQVVSIPVRSVFKLVRGIVTGEVGERNPWHLQISNDSNPGIGLILGAEFITMKGADPITKLIGVTLITGTIDLLISTNCQDAHISDSAKHYCANVDKINNLGYKVTTAPEKLGVLIHNIFKRKHRYSADPVPAPSQQAPPVVPVAPVAPAPIVELPAPDATPAPPVLTLP